MSLCIVCSELFSETTAVWLADSLGPRVFRVALLFLGILLREVDQVLHSMENFLRI
jgi:hypothetical protein